MTALLLLSLLGCSAGPIGAPYGSTLDLTNLDNVYFALDAGLLEPSDQRGALIKLEALVTVPGSYSDPVPGNGIRVEVSSGWSEAYLLPESAVRVVDDFEVECDESGASSDPEDPCYAWFDNNNEVWVEFGGDYTDLENFRPTYFQGVTDARGTMGFYVFIDSVPVDADGEPVDFSVYGTINVDDDSVTFSFGGA